MDSRYICVFRSPEVHVDFVVEQALTLEGSEMAFSAARLRF